MAILIRLLKGEKLWHCKNLCPAMLRRKEIAGSAAMGRVACGEKRDEISPAVKSI